MTDSKKEYGFIIGTTFVISISILICYLSIKVFKQIHDKFNSKKLAKNKLKFMLKLKNEDKVLLEK